MWKDQIRGFIWISGQQGFFCPEKDTLLSLWMHFPILPILACLFLVTHQHLKSVCFSQFKHGVRKSRLSAEFYSLIGISK